MRLGLLSTARINELLVAGARAARDIEVVAIGSRDRARAEARGGARSASRARTAPTRSCWPTPDVEAVYIALPNSLHVEWSLRALQAGRHVLCEKPLSRHPEEVERAFDAAERSGLVLAEAFMWRHHPQARRLVELLDQIGELRLIRASFSFVLEREGDLRLSRRARRRRADGRRLLLRERRRGCWPASRVSLERPAGAGRRRRRRAPDRPAALRGRRARQRSTAASTWPRATSSKCRARSGVLWLDDPWHSRNPVIELRRADGSSERIAARAARPLRMRARGLRGCASPVERAPRYGREDAVAQARTIAALYASAEANEPTEGGTMKTSLGIWAFGPMITRFVPGGYQPAHAYDAEPVAEKVHRAVEGLGDLIDGYEFHYPQELSHENISDVQEALGEHDVYCVAGGLHLDPRFGRGGLVNPDEHVRAEARRIVYEGAEFAGSLGAHMIIWPGIEGYNYPFQTPYVDSWHWLIEGIGEAAEICKRHGVKLFLEHKNSEPAMKILMRNMGMTMFVAGKLRAEGLDNVQINMDWQHLLMNDEHLPEYAALLHSEGLLGHQHGNSGWGTFDDDNMLGTTAFMETIELALELRRCGYGENGERLGLDLYPYTEDQIGAVKRSIIQWNFIDSIAARIDDAALREAQSRKDAVAAYELVYAALGA